MKKAILALTALALLAGCATRADNIAAAYVSPIGYQGLSCGQLGNEAQAISSRAVVKTVSRTTRRPATPSR